jgi:hypothetical protein
MILLLVGVAAGSVVLAVVVTPVVVVAVLSGRRAAVRGRAEVAPSRGPLLAALVVAGCAPLVAVAGVVPFVVVAGGGFGAAAWLERGGAGGWPAWRPVATAAAPVVAGGSLVLASRQGTELATVLILAVCLFDAANAVMGTAPTGGLLGAVAGAATVLVLAVVVESLLVPPFVGRSPWILCASVAVCAPLGVLACGRLAPGRVPALRRLDSLVVAGPLWLIVVAVALHP